MNADLDVKAECFETTDENQALEMVDFSFIKLELLARPILLPAIADDVFCLVFHQLYAMEAFVENGRRRAEIFFSEWLSFLRTGSLWTAWARCSLHSGYVKHVPTSTGEDVPWLLCRDSERRCRKGPNNSQTTF